MVVTIIMTLSQLLIRFCKESFHLKGVSPHTVKRYTQTIHYFLNHSRITHPQEITKQKLLAFFMYGRSERNWTAATYRTYHFSLRVFFAWLKDKQIITDNPIVDMKLPCVDEALPKALTQEETQRLLHETLSYPWSSEFERLRNYAMMSTYIFTGVRRNELLNLCESDVLFEQRILRVHKGKGRKDRVIPLNDVLIRTLKEYLHEKHQSKYTSTLLFNSVRNHKLSETGIKRVIEKLKEATGLNLGNHILRHTFAILMLQGGCDIVSLSKMMGHRNIKTTMKYLLVQDDHLKSQIAKHPLQYPHSLHSNIGTIPQYTFERNSDNGFQRPQEHHVLRNHQLAQQQHPFWYPNTTGYSVPRHGRW